MTLAPSGRGHANWQVGAPLDSSGIDGLGVEDHEVGPVSGRHSAAVVRAVELGGDVSELSLARRGQPIWYKIAPEGIYRGG